MTALPQPSSHGDTRVKNRTTENFPVGSFLIRPNLRTHIHTLYNFARAADDISDDPLMEPQEKIQRLNHFAAVLTNENLTDAPPALQMRQSLTSTGITPQHCLDLLTAFKRDTTQLRYADWDDLLDYCRYSASPVGRHVLALHGVDKSAWPASDALCTALQIINHVQDCADDYRELDRVYIPQDMLAAHEASIADLSRAMLTPGLRLTLDAILQALTPLLIDARELPRQLSDVRLKCEASVICVLAERLVKLLQRYDPLRDHVRLGKLSIMGATITGLGRMWF
jgi:hydroxysqualene synthase